MIPYVICNAAGQVLSNGIASAVSIANMVPGPGNSLIIGDGNWVDDWVNGGVIERRPAITAVAPTKTLAVGEDWIIPGVPNGTEVWIDGALVGTVDATGLTLSFPLAATWSLRFLPPFPWKPVDCEVSVS